MWAMTCSLCVRVYTCERQFRWWLVIAGVGVPLPEFFVESWERVVSYIFGFVIYFLFFMFARRRLVRIRGVGIKERASWTAPRPEGSPSGIRPASAARRCSRPSSRICSSPSPPRCPPACCSNTHQACRISPGNRRITLCCFFFTWRSASRENRWKNRLSR